MTLMRYDLQTEANQLQPKDEELIHKASRGDDTAYAELIDRHAPALYRLAFSLVGNAHDAEDVLQETFSGAFAQAARFEGRAAVKTWLTQILVRQAAKCRRARRKHRLLSLEGLAESLKLVIPGRRAAQGASEVNVRLDIAQSLENLPPEYREVIALREMQGLSYEEIAEVLDIPRGTVDSRLFRARQELKQALKDYLSESGS